MALLIDGYNLLHAGGFIQRGLGPGGLERARLALLNFLVESLDPATLARAAVVFDSRSAPPDLPRVVQHRGLKVHFAAEHESADALLEELIRADSAPKQLIVVSSDHRLHRAARRRKATPMDSDAWYDETLRQRHAKRRPARRAGPDPVTPEADVDYWVSQFSDPQLERESRQEDVLPPDADDL